MAFSEIFSRVVEQIGAATIILRGQDGREHTPAFGGNPTIPPAKAQGSLPTLKMPTAKGWSRGQAPNPAPGLKVNAFATDLKHPRSDPCAAEWRRPRGRLADHPGSSPDASVFDHAMFATMRRAAALGDSPSRIMLLRDANGDGVAEVRNAFLEGLRQPFGMALLADTLYVGNTDGVVAFPYASGANRITEPGRRLSTTQWRGTLDAQPAPVARQDEALHRCRLADQHRRQGHGR